MNFRKVLVLLMLMTSMVSFGQLKSVFSDQYDFYSGKSYKYFQCGNGVHGFYRFFFDNGNSNKYKFEIYDHQLNLLKSCTTSEYINPKSILVTNNFYDNDEDFEIVMYTPGTYGYVKIYDENLNLLENFQFPWKRYDNMYLKFLPNTNCQYIGLVLNLDYENLREADQYYEILTVDKSLATEVLNSGSRLKIFPNPTVDKLTIENDKVGSDFKKLTVTNVAGQVLQQKDIKGSNNQIEVDLSNYASGTYMIDLNGYSVKVIKE